MYTLVRRLVLVHDSCLLLNLSYTDRASSSLSRVRRYCLVGGGWDEDTCSKATAL